MKNKIIIGIWILIIIIGLVMAVALGFNLDDNYGSSTKVIVDFDETFDIADVESIVKDVLGDTKFKVEYSNEFKNGVLVSAKEFSDEQIDNLESKLIEKYEGFNEGEDIAFKLVVPSVSILDLVKVYIKPVVISMVITLIVLMIIFRNLGFVKAFCVPLFMIIGICTLYVSIIAILRVPVNEIVIATGIFVYTISLIIGTLYTKSKCN